MTRTPDLLITNQLLYRLSYTSIFCFAGFLLLSLATTSDLLITNQLLYRLSYTSLSNCGVAGLIVTNQLLCPLKAVFIVTQAFAKVNQISFVKYYYLYFLFTLFFALSPEFSVKSVFCTNFSQYFFIFSFSAKLC